MLQAHRWVGGRIEELRSGVVLKVGELIFEGR